MPLWLKHPLLFSTIAPFICFVSCTKELWNILLLHVHPLIIEVLKIFSNIFEQLDASDEILNWKLALDEGILKV
jgi:hypothetical protein